MDTLPDAGLANDRDFGKHAQQPKQGTFHCGLTHESERDCHDTFDLGRKEEKYHRGRHNKEDDRHLSREVLERERSREREMDREGIIKYNEQNGNKHRDRDGYLRREREWEKRKEIEADRGRRKERDSIDRDRRGEKVRDYLWDKENDRGRSRDKARYSSRERERGNEKERRSEKDRDKGREFQSDREKHKILNGGYGEVRHKQFGHSRHDAEDDLELRNSNSINGHNPKGGNSKDTWGNVERYCSPKELYLENVLVGCTSATPFTIMFDCLVCIRTGPEMKMLITLKLLLGNLMTKKMKS